MIVRQQHTAQGWQFVQARWAAHGSASVPATARGRRVREHRSVIQNPPCSLISRVEWPRRNRLRSGAASSSARVSVATGSGARGHGVVGFVEQEFPGQAQRSSRSPSQGAARDCGSAAFGLARGGMRLGGARGKQGGQGAGAHGDDSQGEDGEDGDPAPAAATGTGRRRQEGFLGMGGNYTVQCNHAIRKVNPPV